MLKLLKKIDKKSWIIILVIFLLVWFQVYLDLKIPDYMSQITELTKKGQSSIELISHIGLLMFLTSAMSLAIALVVAYLVSYFTANFSMSLRDKLYHKVLNLDFEDIQKMKPSSLITRTTNDITQIETMLGMGVQSIFQAPIMGIWTIKKVLNKNWMWSLATGVAVLILLTVIVILVILVLPKFSLVQKQIDKLNLVTRENLTGIRVIRAFNAEKYQESKFEEINSELTDTQMFSQRVFALLEPTIYMILFLLSLAILYLGAFVINKASLDQRVLLFGDMVVFSAYAMQIIFAFLTMAFILVILSRAKISADRINEVFELKEKVHQGSLEKVEEKNPIIEFKNVSFKYSDAEENVVSNLTFSINKGEKLGIIGSTGSGKSTLLNLIVRFFDPSEGEILLYGKSLKEYKRKTLNNLFGYAPQKPVVFNMTILDNVKFGSDLKSVSDQEAVEAIEIAQAKDFVLKLKNKYDTKVARGGTDLSGGQKQRLSIARAIARKPQIYLFDDSFSALDNKTDLALRQALFEHTADLTTITVATRIGTILNSDKIIVLDQGKIVGLGSHDQLLETCEVYRQIASSQLEEKKA